jgi:tRNA dimethylallyltransferase
VIKATFFLDTISKNVASEMTWRPNVIFIIGPTGSGKSAMAVNLAKHLMNAEVINADAFQVYRGFDIGTAKMSIDEQEGIRHHCLDLVEPGQSFSVQEYLVHAIKTIGDIRSSGKVAIVVGGSNMYLQALIWNSPLINDGNTGSEPCTGTWEDLHAVNPIRASQIHRNDNRRIQNALMREAKSADVTNSLRFDDCHVVLMDCPDADWMRARLDARIDLMIERGLSEEAQRAMKCYQRGKGVLQAIGYREFVEADDADDLRAITGKIKNDTWKYFRKQLKWLKNTLLPRLPFEPLKVQIAQSTTSENLRVNVESLASCLFSRELIKSDEAGTTDSLRRFKCNKCDVEFPGRDVDWSNHIRSSRHKRKRKRE